MFRKMVRMVTVAVVVGVVVMGAKEEAKQSQGTPKEAQSRMKDLTNLIAAKLQGFMGQSGAPIEEDMLEDNMENLEDLEDDATLTATTTTVFADADETGTSTDDDTTDSDDVMLEDHSDPFLSSSKVEALRDMLRFDTASVGNDSDSDDYEDMTDSHRDFDYEDAAESGTDSDDDEDDYGDMTESTNGSDNDDDDYEGDMTEGTVVSDDEDDYDHDVGPAVRNKSNASNWYNDYLAHDVPDTDDSSDNKQDSTEDEFDDLSDVSDTDEYVADTTDSDDEILVPAGVMEEARGEALVTNLSTVDAEAAGEVPLEEEEFSPKATPKTVLLMPDALPV